MKLSIVIPTLNERNNIEPLVNALREALASIEWEVIFVDDNSSDGTVDIIKDIAKNNYQVKYITRLDKRGISSACILGMNQSKAEYVAVMDGDLQHDPNVLREMLFHLEKEGMELVIASRYVNGASIYGWSKIRVWMSYMATWAGYPFIRKSVRDPLSGFFILKRSLYENNSSRICNLGSKILMSILIYSKDLNKITEIPFHFKPRGKGRSKHNLRLVWENCLIVLRSFTLQD